MFEKSKKYMITTVLLALLTAGLVAAVRPGITVVKETGLIDNQIPSEEPTTTTIPTPQLIGGQLDIHGCLTAAGFSWNETTNKCIRPWSGEIQLAAGTMLVDMSDPNWQEKLNIAVPIADTKCVDSDGGKTYDIFGITTEFEKNPRMDACVRHRFLREWYCSGNKAVSTFTICKEGCKNGACLP